MIRVLRPQPYDDISPAQFMVQEVKRGQHVLYAVGSRDETEHIDAAAIAGMQDDQHDWSPGALYSWSTVSFDAYDIALGWDLIVVDGVPVDDIMTVLVPLTAMYPTTLVFVARLDGFYDGFLSAFAQKI